MPFTTFYDQELLAYGQGDVVFTPPGTLYIALSTTAPTQAKGTTGAFWNFTEPSAQVQLTTALLTATAYTSLAVSSLDAAVALNDAIAVTAGGTTNSSPASAVAATGALSISVTSFTTTAAFPVGSLVHDTTASPGYARVPDVNNTVDWTPIASEPAAGYTLQNGNTLNFPASTGAWNGSAPIPYFGAFDAIGGGNLLFYGALSPAQTVSAAGVVLSFPVGSLTTNLT